MINQKFSFGLLINIVVKLMAIALGLYTTRWLNTTLTADSYTTYNLIEGLIGPVLLFSNLGIPIILQKYYANQDRDKVNLSRLWTSFLYLRVITFFVGLVGVYLVKLINTDLPLIYSLIIYFYSFITIIDYSYFSIYSSKNQTWKFSLSDFIGKLFIVVALLSFWLFDGIAIPIEYFLGVSVIGYSISLLIDALWLNKETIISTVDYGIIKKELRPMMWLGLSAMIIGFYQYYHVVFLDLLGYSGEEINGFKNSIRIVEQAIVVSGVVVPQTAIMLKRNLNARLEESVTSATKYLYKNFILFALLLVIGYFAIVLVGPYVLQLIDPDNNYPIQYELLPILALFGVVNIMSSLVTLIKLYFSKERLQFFAVVAQAILAIILYYFLINMYGTYGAAWAVAIVALFDLFVLRLPMLSYVLRKQNKSKSNT